MFLVLEHKRRKVLQFGVTDHPTTTWAGQRIVEAFADQDAPKMLQRYLIRDRDGIFGIEFRRRVQSLGVKEIITTPQSPWQNRFAERLVGSIRRECLNHFAILTPRHLRRILKNYFAYYNESPTHLSLEKDSPEPRAIQTQGKIVAIRQVVDLHHRYERQAA